METGTAVPPWEMVQFQQSIVPEESFFAALEKTTFGTEWKEIPHIELNTIKRKIAPLEENHVWEQLKKKTNPYELVYTQDNSECPSSVSLVRPLSRSYFKMIEILQVAKFFDRLPKTTQKIRSAHVAEGPGGFIEALLDRAEMSRIKVKKIYAMTLRPTNNHVPGWRRTYSFLQKHPEIRIHYGKDDTGDLYIEENQKSFVYIAGQEKVHFFSGDGGFDFSVDYENQEKSVFQLLVASAIVGLQILGSEGMFVLKLFDLFSEPTQILLRLITVCFREWTVYKPATSRPCNSERYLVCRGFRKCYPQVLRMLLEIQSRLKLKREYPQVPFFSFFSEKEKRFLEDHLQRFNLHQMEVLERTISLQTLDSQPYNWDDQYKLAKQWCNAFHIPTFLR
jgi:23S rRNA U2552 (ribose-2'-O)-methylase RlmE/FtsJ